MKNFNAIIIEDEANVRDALAALIHEHCPLITVCGLAGSAEEGRELLLNYDVDFIFLDILMPNEDGFAFLESVPKATYGIIFTTAYHEFAMKAIKENAVDYLLKPINPQDLKEAVNKAVHNYNLRIRNTEIQKLYEESIASFKEYLFAKENPISKVVINEQFGFRMINISDIMYLEADGNYTTLYLANGEKVVATRNLGEFEKMINNPAFFRSHKSFLLHIKYLAGYSSYQGYFAELKDGTRLSISRRKLLEFRAWIKRFSVSLD